MREDKALAADIVQAARPVQTYIAGMDLDSFAANQMVCDAVVRQIEIIGEAASKISTTYRQAFPQIPWRKMSDMRNVLIHQYDEVDLHQVWNVAVVHLPQLLKQMGAA